MVFGTKIVKITYDIFRGINQTLWADIEGAEKVKK